MWSVLVVGVAHSGNGGLLTMVAVMMAGVVPAVYECRYRCYCKHSKNSNI